MLQILHSHQVNQETSSEKNYRVELKLSLSFLIYVFLIPKSQS